MGTDMSALHHSSTGYTFEQLTPGLIVETYGRTISEADLVTFLGFSGLRMPIFLDAHWAKNEGPFGERIAPGFMTASISAGMLETVLGHHVLAGLSMDKLEFPSPVRIGDTIRAQVSVLERRHSSKPGRGIVTLAVKVINQHGMATLQYRSAVLLKTNLP